MLTFPLSQKTLAIIGHWQYSSCELKYAVSKKKKKHWVSNTVQNKEFKIMHLQIFYWRYVEMTSGYIKLNKIYDEIVSVTFCLMWLLENKFEFHMWQRWSFDGTTLLYTCGVADIGLPLIVHVCLVMISLRFSFSKSKRMAFFS